MRRLNVSLLLGLFSLGCATTVVCGQTVANAPAPARNRLVRVVTISQDEMPAVRGEQRLNATLARLDQATGFEPDIACLPEGATLSNAETLPSSMAKRVGQWAHQHNCYVIFPLYIQDGKRQYNSALLIDRKGDVVGRYNKIRPTEGELQKGISPGALDPPVFKTDFGVIGIQICFDVNWPEQWRRLKQRGAEIVFFPAAFPGARQLAAYAWENQYFVVSSARARPSSIFDITGEKLATTGPYRQWAGAVLPLGERVFEVDNNVDKMREIERKFGRRVQVNWYHDDDLITLASLDPALTVDDLINQFGLTPHTDYMRRSQQAQDAARP